MTRRKKNVGSQKPRKKKNKSGKRARAFPHYAVRTDQELENKAIDLAIKALIREHREDFEKLKAAHLLSLHLSQLEVEEIRAL